MKKAIFTLMIFIILASCSEKKDIPADTATPDKPQQPKTVLLEPRQFLDTMLTFHKKTVRNISSLDRVINLGMKDSMRFQKELTADIINRSIKDFAPLVVKRDTLLKLSFLEMMIFYRTAVDSVYSKMIDIMSKDERDATDMSQMMRLNSILQMRETVVYKQYREAMNAFKERFRLNKTAADTSKGS